MKKILFLLSCSLLLTVGAAQQDSTGKKKPVKWVPDARYCAMLNGGNIEITQNGILLKADVKFKNGNKLTATGMVIRRDGTIQLIKPGTCVNSEGNDVERAGVKK